MATGVHPISHSGLLDRELRCQTGRGLAAWSEEHGVPTDTLVEVLEGRRPDVAGLIEALATTLGVSVASLRPARSAAA